ncbi:MAG: hypothetical protein JST54_28680 [Deltaproteobacteria bacterium]|nr:hypothetical protein [Deltaproteobacteria bacterium]
MSRPLVLAAFLMALAACEEGKLAQQPSSAAPAANPPTNAAPDAGIPDAGDFRATRARIDNSQVLSGDYGPHIRRTETTQVIKGTNESAPSPKSK